MLLVLFFNLLRYGMLLVLFLFVLHVVRVVAADLRRARPVSDIAAPEAVLIVEESDGFIPFKKGTSFSLGTQSTVGRGADNDLVIPSPYVSQYHAVFRREENCYFLEDLNSTNGTYINGKRLNRPQDVGDGDLVFIGGVTFRFKRTDREKDEGGRDG